MQHDHQRRRALRLFGGGALGLTAAGLVPGVIAAARAQKPGAAAPNVVFIMTDDHAQKALGVYGDPIIATPNLDRIGNEGLRFTESFVTTSLCSPSRASYVTGLYAHSHGVTTNGEEPGWYGQGALRPDQVTWPMLLREAGWHTALVGKWHIKSEPTGFDHWSILPGQGSYFDPDFLINGEPAKFRGHTDDVITDQAMAYLRHRPKDRPFALCFHFKAPHGPWEPDPRFYEKFADVEFPYPVGFGKPQPEGAPEAFSRTTQEMEDMNMFFRAAERRPPQVDEDLPEDERLRAVYQAYLRNYYRVLLGVDENVGRVLDFLDAEGLADNTIVVYTSDNGNFLGEHNFWDKRQMLEPSIRVPMMLRWPERIRPGRVDAEHMVLNIDVAPTLLDLAGQAPPPWMQGESWKPFLLDADAEVAWRDAFLYEWFEYPAVHCARKHRGVRTARWKLMHFYQEPDEWALYDLENDPDEQRNLIDDPAHATTVTLLRQRLAQLRAETGDIDPPGAVAPALEPGKCPA
ncbi:sulfatase family protein [Coralloluteibacterium stylophorae]|uniref:Sulfatase n=1 Tax=Coralloluteibacterium stylophorae TaxID=1776034 RepID=A0A8J8AY89_9GAMM|nr:sulfatase [Coralloluteibacterium stylophorae]MBS7456382.1 sulfatase [Coralloluteibacterium stylophorae]